MEVGEKRQIIVVPGMEIETAEEIHVVALFGDLKNLLEIQSAVYDRMSRIRTGKRSSENSVFSMRQMN